LASNRDDSFILASQIDAQGFQLAPFSPTAALASVVSAQFRRANPLNNDQNLQAFAAMQQPFRPQLNDYRLTPVGSLFECILRVLRKPNLVA
jgi:hypothetical protein